MNPIQNPFSPGAGTHPPSLVGREPLLEKARVALGRIQVMESRGEIAGCPVDFVLRKSLLKTSDRQRADHLQNAQ